MGSLKNYILNHSHDTRVSGTGTEIDFYSAKDGQLRIKIVSGKSFAASTTTITGSVVKICMSLQILEYSLKVLFICN